MQLTDEQKGAMLRKHLDDNPNLLDGMQDANEIRKTELRDGANEDILETLPEDPGSLEPVTPSVTKEPVPLPQGYVEEEPLIDASLLPPTQPVDTNSGVLKISSPAKVCENYTRKYSEKKVTASCSHASNGSKLAHDLDVGQSLEDVVNKFGAQTVFHLFRQGYKRAASVHLRYLSTRKEMTDALMTSSMNEWVPPRQLHSRRGDVLASFKAQLASAPEWEQEELLENFKAYIEEQTS